LETPAGSAAVERLSEGEERFERLRRRAGAIFAPVVLLTLLLWPMPGLSLPAHRLAAVMATVVVLWISEALPMPVTALLGVSACVILKVAPAREAFAPFADPLMFLFIGSFILARAIFLHHLDRRLAFGVLSLRWVGGRPSRILFAFGAVTAFISAWISNTATTAMMFAIGMSILGFLYQHEKEGGPHISRQYATALMLMTSFAASIGGMATPIGTPPNLIGLGFIRRILGVEFPFFKWVLIGAPAVIVLFAWTFFFFDRLAPAGVKEIPGSAAMLDRERSRLGKWSTGERSTAIAFLVTVALWVIPGMFALFGGDQSPTYQMLNQRVPEGVAALIGAGLLFVLPGKDGARAIDWQEASKIDWGVVLLYGGGFALGVLSFQTGLAEAVGRGLTALLPIHAGLGLLFASTLVAMLLSETTSNTASANMIVPVAIAIAQSLGADPLEPALGATMGASLGFMLPVSTPCNAIVYGSGYVPLRSMMKYGLLLDVVGVVVITALVRILVPLLR
jgi:sodium-dependent dicarboxylate transporter 2/3/5